MTRLLKNKLLFTTSLVRVAAPATFENAQFDYPDTVDKIDDVPERARGLYVQDGDKWKYNDPAAVRNALSNTRVERDRYKTQAGKITAWEKIGKSPEEIEALLNAENEREEKRLKDEGDWTALRTQMETNHNDALSAKDKVINKYKSALEGSMIDSELKSILAEKDVEGNPLFLLPHLRGRVSLEESDNGFSTVVKREDGTPMLNGQNQPATLKDLVLEFKGKEQFAGAFKGLNQSGGGATGGSNGGGGTPPAGTKKRSEMSPAEKVAYIGQHGKDKYEQLPA